MAKEDDERERQGDSVEDDNAAARGVGAAKPLWLDPSIPRHSGSPTAVAEQAEGAARAPDRGDARPDRGSQDGWSRHARPSRPRPPPSAEPASETGPRHKPSGHALPAAVSSTRHAEPGDALDLANRDKPSSQTLDPEAEMLELYELGDFSGALRASELLLGRDPGHQTALDTARRSREQLEKLHATRIGSLQHVPRVVVPGSEVRWLGLDHRAGFLLSRIDGVSSVEELLDVCGMDRLEALRTLVELLERGAIELE